MLCRDEDEDNLHRAGWRRRAGIRGRAHPGMLNIHRRYRSDRLRWLCGSTESPICALSNGILLLPVFKPSLKFFRDPIVGVRLVLKASDLFEVPVGPGGRNAPILAFGAPDLQDWDGRHGRPPQVQTVSNRILGRINGHKCTEFRDENAAPLSVPAIRENCRRAEKRSADATRVKDGLEGIVSKRLGSRYRSGRS